MGNASLPTGDDLRNRSTGKLWFGERGNGSNIEDRITVQLDSPLLVSIPQLCEGKHIIPITEVFIYNPNVYILKDNNGQRYDCVMGRIDGHPDVPIPLIVEEVDGVKKYTPLEQHPSFYR